ncbi:MAG: glycerophosphodiester phosphodiesterase [Deltaproteobacteria bacterium]|nr:glycerophosphodiester phosphodiesterase [Deltaproteobacteria bacterium]
MKPFLAHPRPWLIAHRGGAGIAPENTLVAFDRAVELGATCLELDVRRSSDDAVMVFHDEGTERITGERGSVEERTAGELARLDAGFAFSPDGRRTFPFRGQGVRIPTLAELLERHPRSRLNIEAKSADPRLAHALVAAISAAGAEERVCIGSADDDQAERLRALLPHACHYLPARAGRRHVLAALAGTGAWLCPLGWDCAELPHRTAGITVVTRRLVRHFHALDMPVFVWTVDDEQEMRELLAAGVDGIMTDRPDLLAKVLAEKRVLEEVSR